MSVLLRIMVTLKLSRRQRSREGGVGQGGIIFVAEEIVVLKRLDLRDT